MSSAPASHPSPKFSILQGILPFDRTRFPAEILAGVTLAALAIPEVMGYTKLDRSGITALVGADAYFAYLDEVVKAYEQATQQTAR